MTVVKSAYHCLGLAPEMVQILKVREVLIHLANHYVRG